MIELYKQKKILQDTSVDSILDGYEDDRNDEGWNNENALEEYLNDGNSADNENQANRQRCVKLDLDTLDFQASRCDQPQEKSIQVN